MSDFEIRAIATNLVEAMRFFGRARADGGVREVPGVTLISCGLNYAAFNAAVLSEPVSSRPGELKQLIQTAADHFDARHLRWTYWLCEDYLAPSQQREVRPLFGRIGLSPLTDPPGMYAEALLAPRRRLPNLTVRSVCDDQTRLAFAHITSVAFDIPEGICRDIYGSSLAWNGSFRGYVGYASGLPVSTSATVTTLDVIGLYSVATLPNCRRSGYAEATMREVLRQEQQRTGITASVLQSTTSGMSLYEHMGYRKLTRFNVYISG